MEVTIGDPRGVFYDLFDEPEAMEMEIRAKVYRAMLEQIATEGFRKKKIAELFGVNTETVDDLKKGRIDKFDLSQLLVFAGRLGLIAKIEMTSSKRSDDRARGKVQSKSPIRSQAA